MPVRSYFPEKAGSPTSFDSIRKQITLNGYWQSEKHFSEVSTQIRSELEPPPAATELEAELTSTPSVFVHVRRMRYSPRLEVDYYRAAMQRACRAVPDCRFEVFGDDLEWAQKNFDSAARSLRFHHGNSSDELIDFRLMTCCSHAIIANSSFSWWAAWLIKNQNKQIWSPQSLGWPLETPKSWVSVPNHLERS